MSFVKNLFSSPKAPQAPDPTATINAQNTANESTARLNARLNRADTYTPFGSVTFTDLGDDRWKSEQTLSPEMQDLHDTQLRVGQGVSDAAETRVGQLDNSRFSLDGIQDYRQSIDRSGLTEIPGLDDFEAARNEAEDAAFNRVWDRLGYQFDEERQALESSLANQGLTLGSEAYNDALKQFDFRKNDARTAAGYDSIAAGRDAFNNQFQNALQARQQGGSELGQDLNLANAGRSQAINDMLLERGQPMNELAALLQGSPAVQLPQQQPIAQASAAPPDVLGAHSLSAGIGANNYNQRIGQQNAGIGALAGLGSAYIGR